MSELGGPVEDLIASGPISKYSQGAPSVAGGPVPEVLKNYMDVSMGFILSGRRLGGQQARVRTERTLAESSA